MLYYPIPYMAIFHFTGLNKYKDSRLNLSPIGRTERTHYSAAATGVWAGYKSTFGSIFIHISHHFGFRKKIPSNGLDLTYFWQQYRMTLESVYFRRPSNQTYLCSVLTPLWPWVKSALTKSRLVNTSHNQLGGQWHRIVEGSRSYSAIAVRENQAY